MKKKGIQKSLRVLCMLLCFFAMTAVRVSAAEAHGQGQKGSLSVVMQNRKTNTKIPGGEVVLYQVAEITSKETEIQYAFTNGFENCGLKLDNLEDELLAEKLKAEIGASAVGVTQTIGADVTAGFSGLEEGIYLDGNKIILKDGAKEIEVVNTADLKLLGKHNFENVMAAVAMAYYDGVSMDSIRKSICEFTAVAHRIEYVTEKKGVVYYNDSKGTNPDAAIKGIQAMNRPTLLIGGGYDKQSGYDEWIEAFDGKVRYLVLIGQTKEKIKEAAEKHGFHDIILCENLEEAVKVCAEKAQPGDAVLLSPACASWGQFDNYEQRGDMFKEYVRNL